MEDHFCDSCGTQEGLSLVNQVYGCQDCINKRCCLKTTLGKCHSIYIWTM